MFNIVNKRIVIISEQTTRLSNIFVIQPNFDCLNRDTALILHRSFVNLLLYSPTLCAIDMSKIALVHSSALAYLITMHKNARQWQYRLIFCHLQPSVSLVLEIAQLDRAFEIFDSWKDAVQPIIQK